MARDINASGNGVVSLVNPINLLLIALFLFAIYLRVRPQKLPSLPKAPAPIVFRTFTPPELVEFDGKDGKPIYFAVSGKVYDVSPGRNFYGPGGPYENFAGRDATRGMACGSFDEDMLTKDLRGPLDDLKDLGPAEMESLENWQNTFNSKYLVIGKLVPVGHAVAVVKK